ncbi:MAG: thrombospondin type 3 repeat-containing protein [Phycisphaerales bacterium]|nr:thrombospondin type 3 repeat-containing protein [Phycisphaerales bacterium]MCB9856260.1 thrombospondin type 3 repeat-containing protein [Phycisphaerales bacterium]MCB9863301.1 thrombospondin type 3 repeat-containing protein [Phycisphaerales bacterium]
MRLTSTLGTLVIFAILSAASPPTVRGELVHYWSLDNTPNDVVGGIVGTLHGGTSFQSGAPAVPGGGQSAHFDGAAGTYINTHFEPALSESDQLTICLWARLPINASAGTDLLGFEQTGSSTLRIGVRMNDGLRIWAQLRDGNNDATIVESQAGFFDDQWHFIVLSRGNDSIKLYVDGGLADTQADATTAINMAGQMSILIGAEYHVDQQLISRNEFSGDIDEVMYFDEVLTADDVACMFGTPPASGQTDCDSNGQIDVFEVCDGVHTDCNDNGIPDSCELANNDCNANMVPDDCEPDQDDDGVIDDCDNCVDFRNPNQTDIDGDGFGDVCDNCPNIPNVDQADMNEDGVGDICPCPERGDMNDDGLVNAEDIQLFVARVLGS